MFNTPAALACRNLQTRYVEHFGRNSAEYKTMGSVALLKFLLSPFNRRGFSKIDVESIPGKKRAIAFRVEKPYCFDVCTPAVDCTTDREVITNASQEIVFELKGNAFRVCDADGKPVKLQFTEEDLQKYCTETDYSYVQRQIFRFLERFEEALDKAIWTLLEPQIGADADGNNPVRMKFFLPQAGVNVINPEAIHWMEQKQMDIGNDMQTALVGGKILNRISKMNKWASLAYYGIDLSKVTDEIPYVFYDRNADSVIGPNSFLQIPTGAAQLVWWNQYKGEKKRKVTNLYTKDTIVLPRTLLPVDYVFKYDPDCEAYTFEPFLHLELAVNQTGGCVDGFDRVNGILRYEDCSLASEMPVCPETTDY